jgi:hypothetical protein
MADEAPPAAATAPAAAPPPKETPPMADEKKGPDFTKALKLGAAVRRWKTEAKAAKAEAAEAKAALAKAPKAEDLAKLKAQANAGAHADAFKRVAERFKIEPRRIEALRRATGYQATDGEPDEAAIKAAIRETVKATGGADVWRGPKEAPAAEGVAGDGKPAATEPPARPAKLPKGEGLAKGAADKKVGGFRMTRAQARDPQFAFDNRAAINEAATAGNLSITD